MQRDHVCDECITTCEKASIDDQPCQIRRLTPSCDHVEIENGCESAIQRAALFQGFDPEEEGKHEEEYSDGFVVVGSCDGTGYVPGNNTNECGS